MVLLLLLLLLSRGRSSLAMGIMGLLWFYGIIMGISYQGFRGFDSSRPVHVAGPPSPWELWDYYGSLWHHFGNLWHFCKNPIISIISIIITLISIIIIIGTIIITIITTTIITIITWPVLPRQGLGRGARGRRDLRKYVCI